MKKSFRYIVIGILVALTFVFAWQVFWLHGLYTSMRDELEREITSCIESADLYDLFYRLEVQEKENKKKNFEQVISISGKSNEAGKIEFEREERFVDRSKEVNDTTVTTSRIKNVEEVFLADNFVRNINTSLHQALDKIIPINLTAVDSVFRENLKQKNIHAAHYYSEVFDRGKNQIIDTSKPVDIQVKTGNSPTLIYFYNGDENLCYRMYMEPLSGTILIRMGGILFTTLLIILILAFAFWYLIRTVITQKTLEEMKDDFTNNMTHELKTPIAVAYSATDALLNFDLSKNEEKRRRYLLICREQLTRLSNLVEQILSMSMEQRKSFALQPEAVEVKPLIQELIEQHRLKTDKAVRFSFVCRPEDLTIYADRTHLSNILSNLIDNAIKYSGEAVSIDIKAERVDNIIRLSITDNGIGIPADKQEHIFDRFYRIPHGNLHNVKGYGLGLFYVRLMTEKHGGSITVKSTPGKGSTFVIQIPDKTTAQ